MLRENAQDCYSAFLCPPFNKNIINISYFGENVKIFLRFSKKVEKDHNLSIKYE